MNKTLSVGTVGLILVTLAGCGGAGGGTSGGGGTPVAEKIAIADSSGGRPRIWVQDLATGSFLVQAESSTARNEMPALSPDSSKIAFISNRSGSDELYVMTVNQPATLQRLTVDTVVDASPAWVSNNRLVWCKYVAGLDSELVAMNLDGTGYTQLTNNDLQDKSPSVSKDGSSIVYLVAEAAQSRDIYRIPTAGGVPALAYRHSADVTSASWLGTGNLLFTAVAGGVESCMTVKLSDGVPSKITDGWGPIASPKGTRIMFARLVSGKAQLFTSTLEGADVRQYSYVAESVYGWDWRG